jgi:diacylglycerol kinase (ATP)
MMNENIAQRHEGFSLKARPKSFVFAWMGVIFFFKREHNARIHLLAAVITVVAAYCMKVNGTEAIALVFCIALVWITEMINTCLEKAMDFISGAYHPQIKIIKDVAAGAVLVATIASLIVGGIIFIPKLFVL